MKQKLFYCCFFLLVLNQEMVAQQPRLVLPIGHTSTLSTALFSPDGKFIATASYDRTVKIWGNNNGKLLRTFYCDGPVTQIQFSPDSRQILATGVFSSQAQLCDIYSGKIINFESGDYSIYAEAACLYANGRKVAVAFSDSTIRFWEISKKIFERSIPANGRMIDNIRISSDNNLLVWNENGHPAHVMDIRTGKNLLTTDTLKGLLSFIELDPGNRYLATVDSNLIRMWDLRTFKIVNEIRATGLVRQIRFNKDGKSIWVLSPGDTLSKRNIIGDKVLVSYPVPSGKGNFCDFDDKISRLVTVDLDECSRVYDINSGNLVFRLATHSNTVNSAFYSYDAKKMVTAHWDGKVRVWNLSNMQLLHSFEDNRSATFYAVFNKQGTRIVTSSLKLWNANDGKLIRQFRSPDWFAESVQFSDDYKMLYFRSHDTAKIFDIAAGKWKWRSPSNTDKSVENKLIYQMSPDGKKFIDRDVNNNMAYVREMDSAKIILRIKGDDIYGNWFMFSGDSRRILSVTKYGSGPIKLLDAETGKLIDSTEEVSNIGCIQYNWKNDAFGVYYFDGSAEIRDADSLKVLYRSQILQGEDTTKKVTSFSFSSGLGKTLLSFGDGTVKTFNTVTGKEVYTLFGVDSSDYLVYIPSGYYFSTPAATKLIHYVTKDLTVISFEQLDIKYNRPDKVLEAIGNADTALINSYRKAWEKRIKKLGIDTTQFRDGYSVPECDFADRDKIEYEQKNGKLSLRIKGNDSTYKLDRFNVWVNESPLFGQRGISIKKKNSNNIDTSITIQLSQGENRIETSITNVNGTESYRMPLYVNYTPAVKQKEMTRFIGIGIDQFQQSNYNLQYSSKDIRDLAVKLKEKYKDNIVIDTLFNENVTTANIKALKQKLQQTTVNDKVIISYSGHGLLSRDYDYYLSTYSVNFSKPEENGLPYDELESLLDSIPARKKLMLIDACHSGEVDKEEGIAMQKMADSLGLSKGIDLGNTAATTQHVGLKNSFELMQSLFVNVGKSTGATIISAAAGNQFALERGDLKNGVFTYSLLEAMNQYPTIKISELKKIVGERVEQLTNGLQKPTSRNENIVVDWSL